MRGESGGCARLSRCRVAGGDAAFGDDGGGLGDDEAGAAEGAAAEVDEVPVVGEAVVRGVFAHGGDDDAVGEMDRAKSKRRRRGWLDDGWGLRLRMGLVGMDERAAIRTQSSQNEPEG